MGAALKKGLTSHIGQLFHVSFEKTLEALGVLVQGLDPLPQVEVLSGQPLDLVLQAGLRVVGRIPVDRLQGVQRED